MVAGGLFELFAVALPVVPRTAVELKKVVQFDGE